MKFMDYTTQGQSARRLLRERRMPKVSDDELVAESIILRSQDLIQGRITHGQYDLDAIGMSTELRWSKAKRPFYNLWPAVLPMLMKLDLSQVMTDMIRPPLPELLLRFPDCDHGLQAGEFRLRTALVGMWSTPYTVMPAWRLEDARQKLRKIVGVQVSPDRFDQDCRIVAGPSTPDKVIRCVYIAADVGETLDGFPLHTVRSFQMADGTPISQCIDQIGPATPENPNCHPYVGIPLPVNLLDRIVAIYACLCLLDSDSGLLDRVVMSADRDKFEKSNDEKYVSRAEKRGIVGWDVGRGVEVMPHFRRPHFAIRWMGTRPNLSPHIRPVKGSVVHRDKIVEMPTGYQPDEEPAMSAVDAADTAAAPEETSNA